MDHHTTAGILKVLWIVPALAVAIAALCPPAFGQGCAMCKTGLLASAEGASLAKSVNLSLLALQVPVMVLLGALFLLIFKAHLRE